MLKKIARTPLAAALCAVLLISARNLAALTVTTVTSDNGYPAHKVQWTDSAGLTRTAIMVDQNPTIAPYTGYLRQYTYQVNGQPRVCTGTENYATGGNLEFSGDGFVQNHTAGGADWSSGNGAGFPGTTTIVLQGSSHAIIQYYMANYEIDGPYTAPARVFVPTTVQWFFADGRDHPIFAVAQDATHAGGNLGADSRSPYGDIAYDGYNTTGDVTGGSAYDAYVGGASYGDNYKFVTLPDGGAVTTNSAWEAIIANTIPYAMQWAQDDTSGGATAVDAEMGHVATLPGSVYDQGEDCEVLPVFDPRTQDKAAGPMLQDESWAFQILGFQWPSDGSSPITEKRLTWGRNFGSVGGFDGYEEYTDITNYSRHWTDPVGEALQGTRADGSLMAYSVFVVLGKHNGGYTSGAVGQQVTQMENVAQAALAVSVGTKATSGPSGVGTAAAGRTITYSPAGFNPTYAAWEISASANAVTATLTPAASHPLANPIFVIDNYTKAGLPSGISINGSTASSGYFATVDTVAERLWITVNVASITSASPLDLIVSEIPGPNITTFSPTNGTPGTMVTITGTAFTGATAVTFNGVNAAIGTVSATSITTTVPSGATTGPISVTTPGGTVMSAENFEPQYTLDVSVAPSASDGTAEAGGIEGGGTLAGGPQTLQATASNGYVFTDWTLSGVNVSESSNYDITLSSNASYVANFSPAYALTLTAAPASGGTVSGGGVFVTNSSQTVMATANAGYVFSNWTDGATVASSDASYTFTLTSNETLDANFALIPATQIQGILTIQTNGLGTVTDNIGNKVLKTGEKITFKAVPAKDQVFVDWSGSTNSTKNPLVFTLESNSVVQANFIPNPFLPTKGIYNGLFSDTATGVTEQTAGMLKNLNITTKGTYTGSVLINGASHGISGSFSLAGQATNRIARSAGQGGPLTMFMNLQNPGTSAPLVTGTVSNSAWVATNLMADIATNTLSPAEYTLLLVPDTNNAPPQSSPGGDGYMLITNAAGTAKMTGALADGAAFSQTTPISQDGYVPVYANLYGGKGLLLGWINLIPTNTDGVGLTWIHGGPHSGLYPNGFTNVLLTNQLLLSSWTNPPAAALLAGLTNLSLLDTIGDTNVLTNIAVSVSGNVVTGISEKVTGSINVKTGMFKVVAGTGTNKVTGYGAVLPDASYGGGYFTTKTNAQAITLGP